MMVNIDISGSILFNGYVDYDELGYTILELQYSIFGKHIIHITDTQYGFFDPYIIIENNIISCKLIRNSKTTNIGDILEDKFNITDTQSVLCMIRKDT